MHRGGPWYRNFLLEADTKVDYHLPSSPSGDQGALRGGVGASHPKSKLLSPDQLNPNDLVTLEELAISTMWETSALLKGLERKGILTRQELYDTINDLRRRHPEATKPEQRGNKSAGRPT